jgi:hypothetical protein
VNDNASDIILESSCLLDLASLILSSASSLVLAVDYVVSLLSLSVDNLSRTSVVDIVDDIEILLNPLYVVADLGKLRRLSLGKLSLFTLSRINKSLGASDKIVLLFDLCFSVKHTLISSL